MDSRIIHENKTEKERVQRVTQEIFGDYPQPRLEFAQYKVGHCYKLTTTYQDFLKRTKTKWKTDLRNCLLFICHFNVV